MNLRNYIMAGAFAAAMFVSGASIYAEEMKPDEHGQPKYMQWAHYGEQGALWNLLPEDKQKLLHQAMEKIQTENAALREQAKALSQEIDASLKSPDFNKDEFLKKEGQLDDIRAKMRKNAEKEFAAVAAQFDVQERKILAEMRNLRHRHFEHHGMHKDKAGEQETNTKG